jgi:hypothetical protein
MEVIRMQCITYPLLDLKYDLELEEKNEIYTARLLNSYVYFLGNVFIVNQGIEFKLVVVDEDKILIDKEYGTFRGAKIAFGRLFGKRGWKKGLKPKWGEFKSTNGARS